VPFMSIGCTQLLAADRSGTLQRGRHFIPAINSGVFPCPLLSPEPEINMTGTKTQTSGYISRATMFSRHRWRGPMDRRIPPLLSSIFRMSFLIVIILVLLASPVTADQWSIHYELDKDHYHPGDNGTLSLIY
ncbi:MAG: hypothetical protein Q7V05_05505, partial [Methanoregula sp.]|nr:hypothetical protein [Methanoregula sp.]